MIKTLGFAAILMATAVPAFADGNCSVATLRGGYGATGTGWLAVNPQTPAALIARVVFDGAGNFTATNETRSINGTVTGGISFSGTYTLNAACWGSVVVSGGTNADYDIVVDAGGTHVRAIAAVGGTIFTVDMTKQFLGGS
jgi:hypothetical protein